ncbi:MAG: hypothetical protein KDB80_06415, partial [Planctomycetes bacterium]|nr:hypothetical protein [Planctomycetota bacterium]
HDVCDLRVELDFRGHEMAAFSIDGIERTVEFDDGKTRVYRYGIDVNFPNGHIEFLGRGCELELRADPVRSKDQRLPVDRRVPLR